MRGLPLKKLRNFGGKLGEQLATLGCTTAGEVWPPAAGPYISTPIRWQWWTAPERLSWLLVLMKLFFSC